MADDISQAPQSPSVESHYAFPPFLIIETIRACNARCSFCPFGTGQLQAAGMMDQRVFAKILPEITENAPRIKRISLHGFGEPLLNPNLHEMVRALKNAGIAEVSIATNVSLLDEPKARAFLDAGVDIMRMSISTVNPQKYPLLRVGLSFEDVLQNARRFFTLRDQLRPDAKIYVSMEAHEILDKSDIEEWIEYWRTFLAAQDMLKISKVYSVTLDGESTAKSELTSAPCHALFQTMGINFDGSVALCCNDFRGGESRFSVGSVVNDSLSDVWNGMRMRRYQELHRMGRRNDIPLCRECVIWQEGSVENITRGSLLSAQDTLQCQLATHRSKVK